MKSASPSRFSQGLIDGRFSAHCVPAGLRGFGSAASRSCWTGPIPPCPAIARSRSSSTAWFAAAIVLTAAPTRSRRLSNMAWAVAA